MKRTVKKEQPTTHERWMRRALELARIGEGLTRPNPPVGAVVVRKGKAVGEGSHRKAGEAHAETQALDAAGERARGATLYVTLEPCCTWGKTPPCTDAILRSGIREVVVAVRDPNPRHAGRGLRLLRRRGVRVVVGVCADEAGDLLAPFAKWVVKGIPFLTLKLGTTLDGRIADAYGSSRWITGPEARRKVQTLRRQCDAILVGKNTIVKDNPRLTPRPSRSRRPYRVIVAADGVLPSSSCVLTDGHTDRTIIAATRRITPGTVALLHRRNIGLLIVPERNGRVSLPHVMRALGKLGILHVVCEGGGMLAEALVRDRLVDRFLFFISPSLLGGHGSYPAVAGRGWRMRNKPLLRFTGLERVGRDILLRAAPDSA